MRGAVIVLALLGCACGRHNFELCGTGLDAPVNVDNALVMYHSFDTDLTSDATANHHDAICSGSCPLAVGGHIGGAASFDGTSCLLIADAVDLRPSQATIALWVSPFAAFDGDVFARPLNGTSSNTNTFELVWDQSQAAFVWFANGTVMQTQPLTLGWHHLAAVLNGTDTVVYVDGVVSFTLNTGATTYGADDVRIGCDLDFGAQVNLFRGLIDDVRFYNRSLAVDEIAALAAM